MLDTEVAQYQYGVKCHPNHITTRCTHVYISKTVFSICIPATRERGQVGMVTTGKPNKPLAAQPLSVLAVSPS